MSQLEFEDYERKRLQEKIETLEHRCSDLEDALADKDDDIERLEINLGKVEEKCQAFREVVEGVEENARNVLRKY